MQKAVTTEGFVDGVRSGNRSMLARAITLIESSRPQDRLAARELLEALAPHPGNSIRLGITGVPGVGKSTFIDQFGINLTQLGHRVAVLAVDPSSRRTGGAILGDKTRMERLAVDPNAFIRPSPAGRTLGGVAKATRESMLLCEAAGYDVVICETVGVGQSETTVSEMVDFFLVLMLSGAGDELQGIKKGVLELADAVAVNKADGDNERRAKLAAVDYQHALHLVAQPGATWSVPVLTCSAVTNAGLDDIWAQVRSHRDKLSATGELAEKRRSQQVRWLHSLLSEGLIDEFTSDTELATMLRSAEDDVRAGTLVPSVAVDRLIERFRGNRE